MADTTPADSVDERPDLDDEQLSRVAALAVAREALATRPALFGSAKVDGDLSDTVTALVDLSEWVLAGTHPHARYDDALTQSLATEQDREDRS